MVVLIESIWFVLPDNTMKALSYNLSPAPVTSGKFRKISAINTLHVLLYHQSCRIDCSCIANLPLC